MDLADQFVESHAALPGWISRNLSMMTWLERGAAALEEEIEGLRCTLLSQCDTFCKNNRKNAVRRVTEQRIAAPLSAQRSRRSRAADSKKGPPMEWQSFTSPIFIPPDSHNASNFSDEAAIEGKIILQTLLRDIEEKQRKQRALLAEKESLIEQCTVLLQDAAKNLARKRTMFTRELMERHDLATVIALQGSAGAVSGVSGESSSDRPFRARNSAPPSMMDEFQGQSQPSEASLRTAAEALRISFTSVTDGSVPIETPPTPRTQEQAESTAKRVRKSTANSGASDKNFRIRLTLRTDAHKAPRPPAREKEEEGVCPVCLLSDLEETDMVCCDGCDRWYHYKCANYEPTKDALKGDPLFWYCQNCMKSRGVT